MASKSRSIVVDASVAASAGRSEHPESRCCRDFLLVMTEADHHLSMSKAVNEEWKLFMGNFARTWLASMVSRGRVRWLKTDANIALRRQIGLASKDKAIVKVMLEDLHLIEAALSADSVIASKDDETRAAFAQASRAIASLRTICWVNPVIGADDCLQWLRSGARCTNRRTLKAFSSIPSAGPDNSARR